MPESQEIANARDGFAAIAAQLKHNYKFEVGDYAWQIKDMTPAGKTVRIVVRVAVTEETAG